MGIKHNRYYIKFFSKTIYNIGYDFHIFQVKIIINCMDNKNNSKFKIIK